MSPVTPFTRSAQPRRSPHRSGLANQTSGLDCDGPRHTWVVELQVAFAPAIVHYMSGLRWLVVLA